VQDGAARFYEKGPVRIRYEETGAGFPLLLIAGGLSSLIFLPLTNALSRSHEQRADRFALDLTHEPGAFITAMKRLSQQNLAEERPSRIVQWLFYSHPPIPDRIEAARAWERQRAGHGAHNATSEVA
jgi:STE24 endopeptidase